MSSIPTAKWENELKVSENECDSINNENVKRILAFLKEDERRINWNEIQLNNVIFIFGNTGSGKTTLAQVLTSTNADLISIEVGENSGEFLIYHKDENIDADLTVVSKTIYLELFIDKETGDIYVDLAGLNDAGRNIVYDFATAYFMKKILEKAENVKMVFTADHSTVRKGVNRIDFPLLLRNISVLLKHVEKYLDGVALIVTKVDSNASDATIIENIARFLIEVKQSLENMQNSEQLYSTKSTVEENEAFVRNAALLIDTFLQRNATGYSRLGIFRRPNAPGPVSEIPRLQEDKIRLKNMMRNNLKYVPLNPDDIGYTISFESKFIIRGLVDEIHENVENDLNQMVEELIVYYERTISELSEDQKTLKRFLTASSEDLAGIQSLGKSTSLKEFVSHIQANLTDSCKRVVHSFLVNIESLDKFLKFLATVSATKFNFSAKKWIKSLEKAITFVQNALVQVSEKINSVVSFWEWLKQVLNGFKEKVLNVLSDVKKTVQDTYETLEIIRPGGAVFNTY